MPLFTSSRSPRVKLLGAAIAVSVLAGCAGNSSTIPAETFAASSVGLREALPDVPAPPKCKEQKSTKLYARGAKQNMKTGGGSLCVPEFAGWGGSLQYPPTAGSAKYAVTLISSTTAYKGSLLPPTGSQTPIFYVQIAFNGLPGFNATLPKGNPLVSSHLSAKKPYTAELWLYVYKIGWSELGSCYQVAAKSKYGGSLSALGAVFENTTWSYATGALEIFKGELVSNKC
jgi:hypothetical protein